MDPKLLKSELKVMGRLPAIFDPLPHASQKRVIGWLLAIYWEGEDIAGELTQEDILDVMAVVKEIRESLRPPSPAKVVAPVIPAGPKVPEIQMVQAVPTEKASYRSKRAKTPKLKL